MTRQNTPDHQRPAERPSPAGRALATLLLTLLPLLGAGSAVAMEQPMIEQPAPAFSLPSTSGETVGLADLRGQTVVLFFATSWCPFCNAEAPHLEQLWQEYRGRGVQVLIIDVGESPETTLAFAERWGLTFPVLLDADSSVTATYAPEGVHPDLPRADVPIAANLVIDAEGRIRYYSLLDTAAFDAKLVKVRTRLEEVLAR